MRGPNGYVSHLSKRLHGARHLGSWKIIISRGSLATFVGAAMGGGMHHGLMLVLPVTGMQMSVN